MAPERELPLEAEPEINQDGDDREHQPQHAVGQQFARDARSDHLDAPVFDGIAKRPAYFLNRLLLRLVTAGLLGNPDQDLVGTAKLLQLNIAETKSARARRASTAISAVPDLARTSISVPPLKSMPKFSPWVKNSVIATIESSAEIGKLMRRKRVKSKCVLSGTMRNGGSKSENADHRQHDDQNAQSNQNEIESQPHFLQIGTLCGRFHRTHPATISRVSVKAVKTVVRMPIPSVTAKPRTGPVPM